SVYKRWLGHLAERAARDRIWKTLPAEIDRWWRLRRCMRLVRAGDSWRVEGEGSERARVAYASLEGDCLNYSFSSPDVDSSALQSQRKGPVSITLPLDDPGIQHGTARSAASSDSAGSDKLDVVAPSQGLGVLSNSSITPVESLTT